MALAAPNLGVDVAEASITPHLSMTWLRVAAAASAGAGLIHAGASGNHSDVRSLSVLFAVAAAAQLGWALLAYSAPRNATRWAGIALHAGCLGFWALTRISGFDPITDLAARQRIGGQDLLAAILAGVALVSAFGAGLVSSDRPPRRGVTAFAGVAALALAVPGAAMRHSHTHTAAAAVDGTVVVAADGHAHETPGLAAPVGNVYMTVTQKAAGDELVKATIAAGKKFATTEAAAAAGYEPIGDAFTGWEHWVNDALLTDTKNADPSAIESLVYQVDRTTQKRTLASAMYILPTGTTMSQVPTTFGPADLWHDHQNLCWDESGKHLAGILRASGTCFPGGTFRGTAPMLHVWVIPNACNDPYAGVDTGAGVDCSHGHAHDAAPSATAPPIAAPVATGAGVNALGQTPAQAAAGTKLINDVGASLAKRFPTEQSVKDAGFLSIGDAITGFEHYINVVYLVDAKVLDPEAPESLVYKVFPDGHKELQSAMFILPSGKTLADVPETVGPKAMWHDHQNLCWEGIRVVGTTDATGACQRGTFRSTAPMLHVWTVDQPCGRFAGIEGSHGTDCNHTH